MPGKDKKRQAKITFDALLQTLSEEFAKIPDHRRANASYKRPDFLGSACARFSLKSPTANSFEEQTKVESRNLQSIYHLGAIPSDPQMRTALDPVDPTPLRKLFATRFATLETAGVVKVMLFRTMDALYRQIAALYDIQIC